MTTAANINSIIGYPYAGNANTTDGFAVEVATATLVTSLASRWEP